ncbi:hypothetical protein LTR56_001381 [Elasticomyces elasticus]|nr:hypothetical protein LTR56_001381 [Elasticomyces elasticus]KAK3668694.1 hypothetical protein LTR22_000582 [Elasticomyces elasticus]KAK4932046.1 hypothetical protein LTR49_001734 [Elasticomyces elasticus]KAK5768422.1 hypothetical protein LTS12_001209 [Elasticomyces elasticus]
MNLDSDISDSETHNANIQQRIRRAAHARVVQMEDDLIQYDHYTRAESARRTLSNTLTQLETHILRSADSRRLLKTAEEALEVQKSAHEGLLSCIPLLSQRSSQAAALTDKLSSTPELLELIFLQLGNADLLKGMQVCRLFNESITGSARVARKLGLRADLGGKVYFPLVCGMGFDEGSGEFPHAAC